MPIPLAPNLLGGILRLVKQYARELSPALIAVLFSSVLGTIGAALFALDRWWLWWLVGPLIGLTAVLGVSTAATVMWGIQAARQTDRQAEKDRAQADADRLQAAEDRKLNQRLVRLAIERELAGSDEEHPAG